MRVDEALPKWLRGASVGLVVFVVLFACLALLVEKFDLDGPGLPLDLAGLRAVSEHFGFGISMALCVSIAVGALVGFFAVNGINWHGLRTFLIVLGVLCTIPIGFVVSMVLVFIVIAWPTNDRDNANPNTRKEMTELTLEWGMLAPFPSTAKDFKIRTEGNMFTRTFAGSFSDSPEAIQAWLDASPGVRDGEREGDTIVLKMGGGANYGTVTVSPDGTYVTFRVSWS